VETFPIGVDDGVDHLTTQQALPAGEAECRASRILQPDGHHQTMTTKTVHELTPGLDYSAQSTAAYNLHEVMPRPICISRKMSGVRVRVALVGSLMAYVPSPIAVIRTCPVRLKRSTSKNTWFQVSSGKRSTKSSS
jgi:hypothetical protein